MRHIPCDEVIAPNQEWCTVCLRPIIWPVDVVDDDAASNEHGTHTSNSGSAAASPAGFTEPSATVLCTCGRSHPVNMHSCPYGGVMTLAPPTIAAITLPSGERVALDAGSLILGRASPDARIARALDPFDGVSRRHAVLRLEGTVVMLADAGSTNGTWIAGRRLELEERLPAGDTRIDLGTSGRAFVTVHAP